MTASFFLVDSLILLVAWAWDIPGISRTANNRRIPVCTDSILLCFLLLQRTQQAAINTCKKSLILLTLPECHHLIIDVQEDVFAGGSPAKFVGGPVTKHEGM